MPPPYAAGSHTRPDRRVEPASRYTRTSDGPSAVRTPRGACFPRARSHSGSARYRSPRCSAPKHRWLTGDLAQQLAQHLGVGPTCLIRHLVEERFDISGCWLHDPWLCHGTRLSDVDVVTPLKRDPERPRPPSGHGLASARRVST